MTAEQHRDWQIKKANCNYDHREIEVVVKKHRALKLNAKIVKENFNYKFKL